MFSSITVKCRTLKSDDVSKISPTQAYQILYSLAFEHQLRILYWYKWMQAMDFVLIKVNASYGFCIDTRERRLWFTHWLIEPIDIIDLQKIRQIICWNHFTSRYENSFEWIFNLSSEFPIAWSFLFLLVLQ